MRKPPASEKASEIEQSLPVFKLRSKAAYEGMAALQHMQGGTITWAELRLLDMRAHFPEREQVKDAEGVRATYLWYLAYQRQLLEDLESVDPDLRGLAERELKRLVRKLNPITDVPGGNA